MLIRRTVFRDVVLDARIAAAERRITELKRQREIRHMKAELQRCARAVNHPEGWWQALQTESHVEGDEYDQALHRDVVAALGQNYGREHAAKAMLRGLRGCRDPLPPRTARKLGLRRGATYGRAAELLGVGFQLARTAPLPRSPTLECIETILPTDVAEVDGSIPPPGHAELKREALLQSGLTLLPDLEGLSYAETIRCLSHKPGRRCRACGEQLPPQRKVGRRRTFCSAKCRQRACRRRAASRGNGH